MIYNPKILLIAFLGGILPSLIWLWFWLKEDKKRSEPKGLLTIIFILGMLAVVCVLPIQRFIQAHTLANDWQIVYWAGAEEIIKYLAVLIIVYKTKYVDEPIEWPIYLITAALGFAALENTLFLIKPLATEGATVSLLTGQLRFLGATLLHTVSSGILGISLGMSFYLTGLKRLWHIFIGLVLAITLHTTFNFFIIKNNGSDFLKVFGFLWVITVVMMLLFEKVRRIN
ncbi:MAG: PrsW family glutamic-type intramembrane protease [Patescibacteria group bacterium]